MQSNNFKILALQHSNRFGKWSMLACSTCIFPYASADALKRTDIKQLDRRTIFGTHVHIHKKVRISHSRQIVNVLEFFIVKS